MEDYNLNQDEAGELQDLMDETCLDADDTNEIREAM